MHEPTPHIPEGSPQGRWRPLIGLAVLAAGVIAVRGFFGDRLDPQQGLALLRSVEDEPWAPPAFVVAYIAGTAAFVPALLFHMVSGATFGFLPGALLNMLGVNASASLHFLAARWLGRHRVASILNRYRLTAFDSRAAEHGIRAVMTIRQLPLPHMAVNVAAGVSALRWRDFALGTLLGTIPSVFIYSYFAASLVAGVEGARERAVAQVVIAAVLVVLLSLAPRVMRRLLRRSPPAGSGIPRP